MEELGDLVFVGGIIAREGTIFCRRVWGHLQQASVHYLYGFNADMYAAHEHLKTYARLLEQLCQDGKVRVP